MAKICAIYVRKSKQNDNSDSMETQIQMCTEYINQKFPHCIIKIYDKDYGITGHSIKKRKDFQRMMQDIKNGSINIVAIQRYDRLARNTRDFCNIYHEMEQVGCELVSVSQRIDTSTPYGKKFMYDLASTAELEWALNSERHKDVNNYARKQGICAISPYCLPFGIKAEIRDGKRVAVIDKEVEHIVRDAIKYYKENQSKAQTTRYINEKYGLNKSHSFIDNLIKSDFYHGSYREKDNYCEAYMTKEEHEELRKISKRYVRYYTSDRKYFIFTGLLKCPICGVKMESQSQSLKSGSVYHYYRCYNVYRTGNCSFKGNINERDIETYLLTHIQDEITAFFAEHEYFVADNKKVVDSGKYKAEMDRLNKLYQKGRIEEDYYDSEYDRLQNIISSHMQEHEPQFKYDATALREVFNEDWQNVYEQLSRENKRAFWRKYIRQITFNQDKTVKKVYFL